MGAPILPAGAPLGHRLWHGAALLQPQCGALVVGLDVDRASLHAARRADPNPRIAFLAANATALPFRSGSFRSVSSMETLEHIEEDKAFLAELFRVLGPDGVCVLSTPNRLHSLRHGITNPFHVREYGEAELTELLSIFFPSTEVFYQGLRASYHARVQAYGESIRVQKERLNPPLRWLVNYAPYRPLRGFLPTSIGNRFIRSLLGLSYPQPNPTDIAISAEPLEDCSNFVVVCRKTRP